MNKFFDINLANTILNNTYTDKSINNASYRRILAMGDWHGLASKALNVIKKAHITNKDFLICLGDYTDRGNENKKCMQIVLTLNELNNVKLLVANHEVMLLEIFTKIVNLLYKKDFSLTEIKEIPDNDFKSIVHYLKEENRDTWMYHRNGGNSTLSEITDNDLNLFKEYLFTISNLDLYLKLNINGNNCIFVHAGINPSKPFEQNTIDDFVWIREEFFNNYQGKDKIFVGHTPTQYLTGDNIPFTKNNIIFCDTGSYWITGKISIIDTMTMNYWQA